LLSASTKAWLMVKARELATGMEKERRLSV
jgi:hypothetical protein